MAQKMAIMFRRLSVWHSALAHYLREMPDVEVVMVNLEDEAGAGTAAAGADWSVLLVEDREQEENQRDLARLLASASHGGVILVSRSRPQVDLYWHQKLLISTRDDLARMLTSPERLAGQKDNALSKRK